MKVIKINDVPKNINARVTNMEKGRPQDSKWVLLGIGIVLYFTFMVNYKFNRGKI